MGKNAGSSQTVKEEKKKNIHRHIKVSRVCKNHSETFTTSKISTMFVDTPPGEKYVFNEYSFNEDGYERRTLYEYRQGNMITNVTENLSM